MTCCKEIRLQITINAPPTAAVPNHCKDLFVTGGNIANLCHLRAEELTDEEAMTGEIFFVAGLMFVLTIVAMGLGFGILKVRGEGR